MIFFALNFVIKTIASIDQCTAWSKTIIVRSLSPIPPNPPPHPSPLKKKFYKLCSSFVVDFAYFTYFLLLAMFENN